MQHTSKYKVIFLTALAWLASCSENDIPSLSLEQSAETYIVFGSPFINIEAADVDFATRSNADLATSVDKFTVWSYCTPRTISSGGQGEVDATTEWIKKSIYFTAGADVENLAGTLVTPTGANNYNNGNLTKWDANQNALYSFIGIAGDNITSIMESASAVSGAERGPRLTVRLNSQANAEGKLDRAKQPDVMVGRKFDHKQKDPVKMKFSHVMTALRFNFRNHSEQDLIIKGMTFSGTFYNEAQFVFTSQSPVMTVNTDKTYSGSFDIIDKEQTILAGSQDYAGDQNNYLLLLPNPAGTTNDNDGHYVLGSNKKIEIVYRFSNDSEDTERTFSVEDFTLNYRPQPNTKHTAYFNFVGDKFIVTFQADENTWEAGSDNEFIIQ